MNLSLIDGDYFLYVATNPDKELDQEDNPVRKDNKFVYKEPDLNRCLTKIEELIIDTLDKTMAEFYLGFLTGGSFRYNIYPDYKANRKDRIRPKYYKVLKEYLLDEWEFIQHKQLEADDLVKIASDYFYGYPYEKGQLWAGTAKCIPTIVSNDKDILNLEGKHYNSQKGEFIETSKEQAERYFWESMIIGDIADNIKGIPGMGLKGTEKLFNGLSEINLPVVVFNQYINKMGYNEGIKAFYKNYKCLTILDEYEGLELPDPIKYNK